MVAIASRWFSRIRVDDDITLLTEPYVTPFLRCNIWHIRGRNKDMLVDTGLGLVSLRQAERDLFDKPLVAVATHAHFDHVGGLHEFQDPCVHVCEAHALATAADGMALSTEMLGEETLALLREAGYVIDDGSFLSAYPYEGFDPTVHCLHPVKTTNLVAEGDIMDIGDRSFEVLHLPGHSPGSIGLYENKTGILFSGDAIYDGPLLYNLPESDREQYACTLRRLMALPITVVHAGHEPSFGADKLFNIAMRYLKMWDV